MHLTSLTFEKQIWDMTNQSKTIRDTTKQYVRLESGFESLEV